ncbi:S1C family serine protease [Streptomyces mesophilus]|uniref:S1C family serine protease n=1 Tax=Streptomyces mesophilus TaxID=1775132 RepID=UPI003326828F
MNRTRSPRSLPRIAVPLTAALGAAALLAGCSGSGSSSAEADSTTQAAAVARKDGAALQEDYIEVIKDVLPSVVQITAGDSLGSGVVYDDKGHIVTNAHVVGDTKAFKVTAATGGKELAATLVSSYPEQDLAVIQLENPPSNLKAAKLGDSSKVEVGQIVLAMGSPLGLSSSVTQGIVSATGRTVSEPRTGGSPGATIGNMVQTSAAINPGNSGGALVNLDGEVVGIPTLAATDPEMGDSAAPGIGFAIPASMVQTIAEQIVKDGEVTDSGRAALDISGRTVLGDDYKPAGVAVVEAESGGAAADAGLEAGDVITRFDNEDISTITSLSEALASKKPGDKVSVTYDRDGSRKTAEVTLGEM